MLDVKDTGGYFRYSSDIKHEILFTKFYLFDIKILKLKIQSFL